MRTYLARITEVRSAVRGVRDQLSELDAVLDLLERDRLAEVKVVETLESLGVPKGMASLREAGAYLEQTLGLLKGEAALAARAQGTSVSRLAKALGVTRQRIYQLAQEVIARPPIVGDGD